MKINNAALCISAEPKKEFVGINIVKFVCAFLVAAIHISPLSTYSLTADYFVRDYLTRIAVPFFFVCSGFFLFRKTEERSFEFSVGSAYALRILKLYIIWTVIYFPLALFTKILPNSGGAVHGFISWARTCIFTGSYVHLWYLPSLIVAVLIVSFLLSRGMKTENILIIALVLYAVGLLGQSYAVLLRPLKNIPALWSLLRLTQKIIITTRNGVFEGLLFVGIGALFAYRPIVIPYRKAAAGFVCCMVLLFAEAYAVRKYDWAFGHDMYIFTPAAVFLLFYLASHTEMSGGRLRPYLRDLSTLMFYLHLLVQPAAAGVLKAAGTDNSLLIYCGTMVSTLLLSFAVIRLSRRIPALRVLYA